MSTPLVGTRRIALGQALHRFQRPFTTSRTHSTPVDRQLQDVIPGDLKATLEAHRASNRASIIHKQYVTLPHDKSLEQQSQALRSDAPHLELPLETQHGDFLKAPSLSNLEEPNASLGDAIDSAPQFRIRKQLYGVDDDDAILRRVKPTRVKHIERLFNVAKHRSARGHQKINVHPAEFQRGAYVRVRNTGSGRFRPWESEFAEKITERSAKLSADIKTFTNWLQMTPIEKAFRGDLTHHIIESMRPLDTMIDFWVFGSAETDLATTMSDIDIGFTLMSLAKGPDEARSKISLGAPAIRKMYYKKLDKLCVFSLAENKYTDHEIVHARYPLLRMKHVGSSVELQVVAARPQPAVNEIIRGYMDEYHQLKPVFFTLKSALAARNLDEVRTGGLGSYTLLMMIVAAFKLANINRRDDYATALMHVLDFYAEFDTTASGIAINPSQVFKKRFSSVVSSARAKDMMREDPALYARHQLSVSHEGMPYLLCLQDPADQHNDLGRGAYRIMDVKVTFKVLKRRLQPWLNGEPLGENDGAPLDLLFGNTLKVVRDRRTAFKAWIHSDKGVKVWNPQRRQPYFPESISAASVVKKLNSDTADGKTIAEAMQALDVADGMFVEDQDLTSELEAESSDYDFRGYDRDSADNARQMPLVDVGTGARMNGTEASESPKPDRLLESQQLLDEVRPAAKVTTPRLRKGWPANQARKTETETSTPR